MSMGKQINREWNLQSLATRLCSSPQQRPATFPQTHPATWMRVQAATAPAVDHRNISVDVRGGAPQPQASPASAVPAAAPASAVPAATPKSSAVVLTNWSLKKNH